MRKVIIAAVLLQFLIANIAYGWIPAVIGMWRAGATLATFIQASAELHAVAAAGGWAYNAYRDYTLPQNNNSKVTSTGDILRDANVTWVDLDANLPVVKSTNNPVKVSHQNMKDVVLKDGTSRAKFPLLKQALEGPEDYPDAMTFPPNVVGTKLDWKGTAPMIVKTYQYSTTGGCTNICAPADTSAKEYWLDANTLRVTRYHNYGPSEMWTLGPIVPPVVNYTPGQTAAKIAGNVTPLVYPADSSVYSGEIDNFIKDNPNIVHFNEPMPSTPSEAAIKAAEIYRAQVESAQAFAAAQAKAEAEASAAQTRATDARTAANTAWSNFNANPSGDNLIAAQLAESNAVAAANAAGAAASSAAGAAAAAAGAAANASGASTAVDNAGGGGGGGEEEQDVAAPIPESEARKTLDFTPLNGLKGALENTYPFNLPQSVKGYYDKLKSNGSAPQFDLPVLGQTIHVDLTIFDPVASVIRFLFGLLATSGVLYYIIHFFRGIS